MWLNKRKYKGRIKKITLPLIFTILIVTFLYTFSVLFLHAQTRSEKELKTFCGDIEPTNPLCLKWVDLTKEKLKLEGTLRHSISLFCNQNPHHPNCKTPKRMTIFTYCFQVEPETNDCVRWKSLKQAELEVKGLLAEEIQKFCITNSTHPLCKARKK